MVIHLLNSYGLVKASCLNPFSRRGIQTLIRGVFSFIGQRRQKQLKTALAVNGFAFHGYSLSVLPRKSGVSSGAEDNFSLHDALPLLCLCPQNGYVCWAPTGMLQFFEGKIG